MDHHHNYYYLDNRCKNERELQLSKRSTLLWLLEQL
jgi:hypothetical protein